MSGWQEVLHQQHLLWKYFHTEGGLRYQQAFVADARSKHRPGANVIYGRMAEVQRTCLADADPIYMDEEVYEVVEAAHSSMKPEPFRAEDFFTPKGFMYLPRPVVLMDYWRKESTVRAISWMPAQSNDDGEEPMHGVIITMYSHRDDPDEYTPELIKRLGEVPHYTGLKLPQLAPGLDLSIYHMMPLWFDESWEGYSTEATSEDGLEGAEKFWRWFQAALRIAQQRVTTYEERRLPRGLRRDLQRRGEERENITVVTLRRARTAKEQEEERDVEWSCRWLVRGHWRNQYYSTTDTHRQLWISGYVKGPQDKELRVTKRAYEFVR